MRGFVLLLVMVAAGCDGRARPEAGALTVEPLESPAGAHSGESHLAVAPDGTVVMSWLEPEDKGHALRYSLLNGPGWSEPRTAARGEAWFVNWADFPSVIPVAGNLWAAHWLARRPEGGYAYDVAMALSTDGGESWNDALSPHTDGTPTEHGFVTLFPWRDGVGAVWLDGREMVPDGGGSHAGHAHGAGGMTLRTAVVGADGALAHEAVLDSLTCDCCQTDVALSVDGPVVVYRDRSPDEIRDIYVVVHSAGGWSEPAPVARDGWRIEGCPVNGPAIDARGGEVAVAWFTAADERPRVRLARSGDGARRFEPPIDVDTASPLGRVDVVLLEDGDAVVSWLASDEGGATVALRRVGRDGRLGPVRVAGRTSAARPAGFPQMVRSGDRLVVSWTEVGDAGRRVVTVRVDAGEV